MDIKIEFEQVWKQYYGTVKAYLSKHVANWQDVDDMANDIFSVAYSHYESFDPKRASIYTWLYNIAMNTLKNYYRDRKITLSIDDSAMFEDIPAPDNIEQTAMMEERMVMLYDTLERLPEKQKTAIRLQYFNGLSGAEIAEKMNISPEMSE